MSRIKVDPKVMYYDPQPNDYALDKDPRCLFGWGPPPEKNPGTPRDCNHNMFGHACVREYRHRGKCWDGDEWDAPPCSKAQRPKDWDERGRAEANR